MKFSFSSIKGLRNLQNLVMLNIAHNHLHSIGVLNACHALQSLDASGNAIQHVEDLSHLTSLKVILHRNHILLINEGFPFRIVFEFRS